MINAIKCRCGNELISICRKTTVKGGKKIQKTTYLKCKKCGAASDPVMIEFSVDAPECKMFPIYQFSDCQAIQNWNNKMGDE